MNRHPGGVEQTKRMLEQAMLNWNADERMSKQAVLNGKSTERMSNDSLKKVSENVGGFIESFARVLDLGAGSGETVAFLRQIGFAAEGVDLVPAGEGVRHGDFLKLTEASDYYDICISQCAFLVSGSQAKAIRETCRVLHKGGYLLLADLDTGNLAELVIEAGFQILYIEDMTDDWREYYIEAIWKDSFCCEDYKILQEKYRGRKLKYTVIVGRKAVLSEINAS